MGAEEQLFKAKSSLQSALENGNTTVNINLFILSSVLINKK
jgi:hypothetical protein